MCKFMSFVTCPERDDKVYYFDLNIRKKSLENSPNGRYGWDDYNWDSHEAIVNYFHLDESICNQYEYDPFTKKFEIDQMNSEINDIEKTKSFIQNLNLSDIIESGIYNLDLFDWNEIPENFTFPDEIKGDLDLRSLKELPEDINLPSRIGGDLYLSSLKKLPKNFKFPEIGGGIYLNSLEELPEDFIFPDEIKGNLNLSFLKEIPKSVKLSCKIEGFLYLNKQIKLSNEQNKFINEHNIDIRYCC